MHWLSSVKALSLESFDTKINLQAKFGLSSKHPSTPYIVACGRRNFSMKIVGALNKANRCNRLISEKRSYLRGLSSSSAELCKQPEEFGTFESSELRAHAKAARIFSLTPSCCSSILDSKVFSSFRADSLKGCLLFVEIIEVLRIVCGPTRIIRLRCPANCFLL